MFVDGVTSTDLLSLVQLLNGAIHALLQNSDLLVLLLSEAIHVSGCIVQLYEKVIDLELLGLRNQSVSMTRICTIVTRLALNESSSSCNCRLNLDMIVEVSELFERAASSARSLA